jgi:transcriptional regulator with XRE-family HTH domain
MKEIGDQIRDLRKEEGLSQEELSFNADLHRTYVGAAERGEKNMTIRSMKKLADGLHATLKICFIKK